MAKIALTIVKVCMHSYFPNADLNLWLNFNFEKLVKRETSLCAFPTVWLKGVKIFWNVSKVCMRACCSNWHPNLWSNLNSKKLRRVVSTLLGLKGVKIAWNVANVGVHACLYNMHPNIWSGLNSKNVVKAETASCSFVTVWLKDGQNSSQHCETWHALLFSKCGFKSMIKF